MSLADAQDHLTRVEEAVEEAKALHVEAQAEVAHFQSELDGADVDNEDAVADAMAELAAARKSASAARRAVTSAKLAVGAAKSAMLAAQAVVVVQKPPDHKVPYSPARVLSMQAPTPPHSPRAPTAAAAFPASRVLSRDALFLFKETCSEFTGQGGMPFARWLETFDSHIRLLPEQPTEQLRLQLMRGRVKGEASNALDRQAVTLDDMEHFMVEQYPAPSQTSVLIDFDALQQTSTVQALAKQFRTRAAAVRSSGLTMNDAESVARFIAKLKPEIRLHLSSRLANASWARGLEAVVEAAGVIERDIAMSTRAAVMSTGSVQHTPYKVQRSRTRGHGKQRRPECKDGRSCELVMTGSCPGYHPACPKRSNCARIATCHYWHTAQERGRARPAVSGSTHTIVSAFATSQAISELQLIEVKTDVGPLQALRDEGATHNFMLSAAAERLRLPRFADPQQFRVLNGKTRTEEAVLFTIDHVELTFQIADEMSPEFQLILSRAAYSQLAGVGTVMVSAEDKAPVTPPTQAAGDCTLEGLREWAQNEIEQVQRETREGPAAVPAAHIETVAHESIVMRQRPYSPKEQAAIDDWIRDALDKELIMEREPSMARYSTNLLPVKDPSKPFGYRITQNLAPVNPVVVDDSFPIPTMEDVLLRMPEGSRVFSTIDLKSGFHQVMLADESRALTGFTWRGTAYVWKRLVMGLSSSPGIFQRRMEQALGDIDGIFIYFDDVIVMSRNEQEHRNVLGTVFERLRAINLEPNVAKSKFGLSRVQFLVFELSEGAFRVSDKILGRIKDARMPATPAEMKSFIGLASLLRRYAPHLAAQLKVLQPLADATKREFACQADTRHREAFRRIRDELAKPMPLDAWSGTAPIEVYTDASVEALSAVLVNAATGHPLAFWSRKTTDQEARWTIAELELKAIADALQRYQALCRPRHIKLSCDNQVVVNWLGAPKWSSMKPKVARLAMAILEYDVAIEYIDTSANPADFFSRYCLGEHRSAVDEEQGAVSESSGGVFAAQEAGRDAGDTTPSILRLPFTWQELVDAQASDTRVQLSQSKQFVKVGQLVCLKRDDERVPVVPDSLLRRALQWLHEGHGHVGVAKMLSIADPVLHIPKLRKLLEAWVRRCNHCQSTKPYASHGSQRLRVSQVARPNQRWQIDFFTFSEKQYLNVVDVYSGFSMARLTPDQTAESTIAALELVVGERGVPKEISSDNGPHFVAASLREFLAAHAIAKIDAVPWHPQSNGAVEASNGALKALMSSGLDLSGALRVHNFVPRAAGMEVCPATAYMNANVPHTLLSQHADPSVFEEQKKKVQRAYEEQYNRRHRKDVPGFCAGQIVYRQNKSGRGPRYEGPMRVEEVHEAHLLVRTRGGRRLRVHKSLAKPGECPIEEEPTEENKELEEEHGGADSALYDVEDIVTHRFRRDGTLELLVKWVGYDERDNSWIAIDDISAAASSSYLRHAMA